MAYLVGDHTLQFVAGEPLEQSAGHRHRSVFGPPPCGKRVGSRIVDHVDRRHLGQTGGQGHFLDHVEQDRQVFFLDLARARDRQHDVVTLEPGGQGHDKPNHRGNDHPGRPATPAPKIFTAKPPECHQQQGGEKNQDDGLAPVGCYLFPHIS